MKDPLLEQLLVHAETLISQVDHPDNPAPESAFVKHFSGAPSMPKPGLHAKSIAQSKTVWRSSLHPTAFRADPPVPRQRPAPIATHLFLPGQPTHHWLA